jgi:hypothetical protein
MTLDLAASPSCRTACVSGMLVICPAGHLQRLVHSVGSTLAIGPDTPGPAPRDHRRGSGDRRDQRRLDNRQAARCGLRWYCAGVVDTGVAGPGSGAGCTRTLPHSSPKACKRSPSWSCAVANGHAAVRRHEAPRPGCQCPTRPRPPGPPRPGGGRADGTPRSRNHPPLPADASGASARDPNALHTSAQSRPLAVAPGPSQPGETIARQGPTRHQRSCGTVHFRR